MPTRLILQQDFAEEPASFWSRVASLHWGLIALLCLVSSIGFALLYSAAGGRFEPWADRQMIRFAMAMAILFAAALVPLRLWLRHAYAFYAGSILLLVVVEFFGQAGGGATRWINLGVFRLQPSEVVKIALVLALARYFHRLRFEDVRSLRRLVAPLFLIALPALLVLKQPDLGTAVILLTVGAGIFFLAGVRWWKFVVVAAAAAGTIPFLWQSLQPYQQKRFLAFLDPESDPLGAGYHIIQSKIALGSGGIWGKGFLNGTQIHLNFLPEMHTDFIFSVLAEEFGIAGGLFLLILYGLILYVCIATALRAKNQFGRLLCLGVAITFFLYLFINMAMVMGLLPVVGVPLPLVSYGGTAMLTLLFGFGLVLNVHANRDERIGRYGDEE